MPLSADVEAVARDAEWLAHRYDPEQDAFHFRRVERASHRRATFLTDEYLGVDRHPVVLRRADAMAALDGNGAPVHFIFHSAFCCSTLLARALDIEGVSVGLKEPTVLNDIVGWRHRGGDPQRIGDVLRDALRLLARPFVPGEAVIIKPSNLLNGLATAMMARRPEARALLLYAPLETYLGSVAKKGLDGRLWARDLLIKQMKEGFIDLGFAPEDYLAQTDLQIAAVGWMAQHALFARMASQGGPRIATLNSEAVTDRPQEVVARLTRLLGLPVDVGAVAEIAGGSAFTTHSKSGAAFEGAARVAEVREARAAYADEIGKVAAWARAVADGAGINFDLERPLVP